MQTLGRAAVDNYNAKIRDLVLLEYACEDLDRLGLRPYLSPDRPRS